MVLAARDERSAQRGEIAPVRGGLQHDGELIRVQPVDRAAALGNRATNAVAELDDDVVSRLLSEAVVDLLEMVDVDQDDRDGLPLLQVGNEQVAVGKLRQCVRVEPLLNGFQPFRLHLLAVATQEQVPVHDGQEEEDHFE